MSLSLLITDFFMHIEGIMQATKDYVSHTIFDTFLIKFLWGTLASIATWIYTANSEVIKFVILLYLIDFFLWVILSVRRREFESAKFFKWAIKLAVYWALLCVAKGIDLVFPTWDAVLKIMFAFIIITDSASIIENLHLLGFEVPYFFVRYLWIAKDRLDDRFADMLEIPEDERTKQRRILADRRKEELKKLAEKKNQEV